MVFSGPLRVLVVSLGWLLGLFLLAPTFVVFPVALNDSDYILLPRAAEDWTLRHIIFVLTDHQWLSSAFDSVVVASLSAVLATALALFAAIGIWRVTAWWASAVIVLIVAPILVPTIISAIAMNRLWTAMGLFDTWLGVILAHAVFSMPFAFITITAALSQLDPRIEQASRSLGAGRIRTIFEVILPNIRSGVFAGVLFSFVLSWDELVVTLFVASRVVHTLPRRMWDGIKESVDPAVAAVAALMVLVTIILLMINAFAGKANGKRSQ